MSRHIKIRDVAKQWQLADIWMRDANMLGRPRGALINENTSRNLAGKYLDDYFNMVEQILRDIEQSASCAGRQ